MDTACLRIKFKPLIKKKSINNSRCCLEIVPEISCMQNLDKLVWRQKDNLIEYTIPMTYKVVLQKREAIEDDSSTDLKVYHSCVDLLLPSSNSMLECTGSGDVPKIISDTYVLKRCIENCSSKERCLGLTDEHNHSDHEMVIPIFDDATQTLLQIEDIERKGTKILSTGAIVEAESNRRQKFLNEILCDESLDKITNTEDLYSAFSDTVRTGTVLRETVQTKRSFKQESTRWLSLSPICSVNADDTPLDKIVASKSVTCKIHEESRRDLILFGGVSSPSDLSYGSQTLSRICDVSRQNSPRKLRVMCRTPPELRVVELVRYIEKEILPLKLWLNDIMRKCTALGIEFKKQPSKQSMSVSVSTNGIPKITGSEETTKSNRVVYSIVFDG